MGREWPCHSEEADGDMEPGRGVAPKLPPQARSLFPRGNKTLRTVVCSGLGGIGGDGMSWGNPVSSAPICVVPPADRASQGVGEGLSFITPSPLPPVSPEGKKRGSTCGLPLGQGITKPRLLLAEGVEPAPPAGSS